VASAVVLWVYTIYNIKLYKPMFSLMSLHWVLLNILTWVFHITLQRISMSVLIFFWSDWQKPWIICQDGWCPHWDSNQQLLSPSPNLSVTYYPHNGLDTQLYSKSHLKGSVQGHETVLTTACDHILSPFLKFTAIVTLHNIFIIGFCILLCIIWNYK
jgi:hypothetical protein